MPLLQLGEKNLLAHQLLRMAVGVPAGFRIWGSDQDVEGGLKVGGGGSRDGRTPTRRSNLHRGARRRALTWQQQLAKTRGGQPRLPRVQRGKEVPDYEEDPVFLGG